VRRRRIKGRAERDEEREGFSPWQVKNNNIFPEIVMTVTGLVSKHSREDSGLLLGGKVMATMERRGETSLQASMTS
jgi:hypothetical protein